jgi:hypothetical protein
MITDYELYWSIFIAALWSLCFVMMMNYPKDNRGKNK